MLLFLTFLGCFHINSLSSLLDERSFNSFNDSRFYGCRAATSRQEDEFYGHGLVDAGACRLESIRTAPLFAVPKSSMQCLPCAFRVHGLHGSVSVWFGHDSGVVAPSLMLGGIFGRLIAALLPTMCIEYLAPDGDFGQYIARLAIVGATCFCGAVCRVHGSAFVLGSVKPVK